MRRGLQVLRALRGAGAAVRGHVRHGCRRRRARGPPDQLSEIAIVTPQNQSVTAYQQAFVVWASNTDQNFSSSTNYVVLGGESGPWNGWNMGCLLSVSSLD